MNKFERRKIKKIHECSKGRKSGRLVGIVDER